MASRAGGEKGLSMETIRSIERGDRETVHPSTARGLERGLDWPAGYVDRLLAGEAEEITDRPLRNERPSRNEVDDLMAVRFAEFESGLRAELGINATPKLSDEQAMAMVLRWLSDDQYVTVARAVTADPRYRSAVT